MQKTKFSKALFFQRQKQLFGNSSVYLQEKRTAIEKEFLSWLKECHSQCDKQVHFSHFKGTVSRPELPKNRQSPWAVYEQIEWDNKTFKKGQMVRIS